MKRRTFLQTTGLALAGAPLARAQAASAAQDAPDKTASVLITSAHHALAQAIAANLADTYRVALTSPVDVHTQLPFTKCDFSDPKATAALVEGVRAIVHVAEPPPGASPAAQIDDRTRGMYNLLQAAAGQAVERVVYLSSLDVMLGCAASFRVTEDWRPVPGNASGPMSRFLGEFTCRQFARDQGVNICVLRLGHVVEPGKAPATETNLPRLDQRDALQAVSLALAALLAERPRLDGWSVFHIVSDLRDARFPATKASHVLGFRPQFAG